MVWHTDHALVYKAFDNPLLRPKVQGAACPRVGWGGWEGGGGLPSAEAPGTECGMPFLPEEKALQFAHPGRSIPFQ